MSKIYIKILIFLCGIISLFTEQAVFAQENSLFSQYFLNKLSYTPTGVLDSSKVSLFYRKQWLGLEDAPETFSIMGNISLSKMGFGIRAFQDRAGLFSQGLYQFSYGYRLKLTEESHFLMGTSFGVRTLNLNSSRLSNKDFSDPVLLKTRDNTSFTADLGFTYISKSFEASISFPHLFKKQLQSTEVSIQTVAQNYHLMATLAYHFQFSNMPLKLSPQVFYKLGAANWGQIDAMIRAEWDEKFWLGAIYRTDYGFAPCVGAKFKDFSLGYAFEISPVERGARGGTSHELMLSYRLPFKFGKKEPIISDTTSTEIVTEIKQTDTIKVENLPEKDTVKVEEKPADKWKKGDIYTLSEVQFNEGTAELMPKSKEFLDAFVSEIEKLGDVKLDVAVHTDNSMNTMSSRILSEQRAKAIQDYLVKQGLSRKSITAVGYGASKLIFKGDEDKKNERVEIKLLE